MTDPTAGADATAAYLADPLGFILDGHARDGAVFCTVVDGRRTFVLGGREATAALFAAEDDLATSNSAAVHELFGDAVFMLRGDDHARARRLLLPCLSGPALEGFSTTVVALADAHLGAWAATGAIDLYEGVRTMTMDLCLRVILGLQDEDLGDLVRRAFDAFTTGTQAGPFADDAGEAARSARATLVATLSGHADRAEGVFGDALSRVDAGRDVAAVVDHMLGLMIAARETTASLVAMVLVELSRIEDASLLAALRAEAVDHAETPLDAIRGGGAPHLRAVLLEAERLHSPNVFVVRSATRDTCIAGRSVAADDQVAYSPAANHLIEDVYADPLRFDPGRFLGRNGQRPWLLTFGSGRHRCPGRQLAEVATMAVVTRRLASYEVDVTSVPPADQWEQVPVRRPLAPVRATVTRRAGPWT